MRCFLFILLFIPFVCTAADDHERLQRIESLALSDWDTAKILLKEVNPEVLAPADKHFYRYLSIYLSTKDTPLETVVGQYKGLYRTLPDEAVKVKVAKSLLALEAYLNEWDHAFGLAKDLEAQISRLNDVQSNLSAWKGMVVFYSQAGLYDMASDMVGKILATKEAGDDLRCFALSLGEEINLHNNTASEKGFNHAIDVCRRAGQNYYIAFNYVHLLDLYVKEEAFNKARIIEKEATWRVNESQFHHLMAGFSLSLAEMRLSEGKVEDAEALALGVIQKDIREEFKEALRDAYRILVGIAVEKQQYHKAFDYISNKQRMEDALHSEQSIKELAFQKAMFDLSSKENEILLLDKQNKLLQAEAKYSSQKMKTTVLALSLVSVMGVALLLWSYRSRRLARRLRYLATRDSLTGVYNRGYFTDLAAEILKRCQKNETSVVMLLLDLDLFKGLNDTYGHQVGDWVLREVARVLKNCCPEKGLATRMGGEEFGILAEGMTTEQGFELAERCRQAIEEIDSGISGHKFTVSASFGVSSSSQVGYGLDNLFSASDLALYQSKRFGRNQVYEYSHSMN